MASSTCRVENNSTDNLFANAAYQSIAGLGNLECRSQLLDNLAVVGFGMRQFVDNLHIDHDCCGTVVRVCLPDEPECCELPVCAPPPPADVGCCTGRSDDWLLQPWW